MLLLLVVVIFNLSISLSNLFNKSSFALFEFLSSSSSSSSLSSSSLDILIFLSDVAVVVDAFVIWLSKLVVLSCGDINAVEAVAPDSIVLCLLDERNKIS